MNLTAHFRKALEDVRTRTLTAAAEAARVEIDRAEERGRNSVLVAFGETFLKALPSLIGGVRQSTAAPEIVQPDAIGALLKAFEESKHPRDHGKFASKPGAGGGESGGESSGTKKPPAKPAGLQLGKLPKNDDEASALAWAARDAIVGPDDSDVAQDGDCVRAGLIMRCLHPQAEVWSGTYDGDVDAGEGGHHVIAKIGDYFIDVTADQFGGDPVVFFTESDLMSGRNGAGPYQYGGFQRSKALESQADEMQLGAGGVVKQLEEYEHGAAMSPTNSVTKSLTPAERLHTIAAQAGYADTLRHLKSVEPWEYADLLALCEDEWSLERVTKADRGHLVRSIITNRLGRRQVVWKRRAEADAPVGRRVPLDEEGKPVSGADKPAPVEKTREQLAESRTVLANAMADPNRLNPEQVRKLADHIDSITKDEAKGLLRVLGQKVSGDQMAVADRLLRAIRAGREQGKGVGDALQRAGNKTTGQYGVWGAAAGGGERPVSRDEFPKRGVGPGEKVAGEEGKTPQVEAATAPAIEPAKTPADRRAGRVAAEAGQFGYDPEGKPGPKAWGKGGGGLEATFETSSGATYKATLGDAGVTFGGDPMPQFDFTDAGGKTGVTGAGSASEVMRSASAALVAAVQKGNLPAVYFSAEEPSRRKLYDRLAAVVASALPGYRVYTADEPGVRGYVLVRDGHSQDPAADFADAAGVDRGAVNELGSTPAISPEEHDRRMSALDPRDSGNVDVPAKPRPPSTDDRDAERYDAAKDKLGRMEGWQADRPSVAADEAVSRARERVRGVVGDEGAGEVARSPGKVAENPRPVTDLTDAEIAAERRALPRNRRTPAQAVRDRELSKEHARRNPLTGEGTPVMMGGGPGPGRSGDGDREMAEQTTGRPGPFNPPDAQGRFPSRVDGVSYGDPEDRNADDRAARRHMRQADKHAAEADKIRDQIEALKAAEADRLKRVEERQRAAQQAVTDTAGRLGDAMGKEEAAKAKLATLRGEQQPQPAPTGQRQNYQTLRRQAADNAAAGAAAMNQPHDGSGLPDQPMYASLSPEQRAEFDRQHREAKTRQDARGVAIRAGNIAAGNESARRSDAAKVAANTPPQSPTTAVDKPASAVNTTPVQPQSAGAKQGGGAMDTTASKVNVSQVRPTPFVSRGEITKSVDGKYVNVPLEAAAGSSEVKFGGESIKLRQPLMTSATIDEDDGGVYVSLGLVAGKQDKQELFRRGIQDLPKQKVYVVSPDGAATPDLATTVGNLKSITDPMGRKSAEEIIRTLRDELGVVEGK